MITASKISSFILVASIAGYFTIIPASVTIHVGDDSDRVNEIGRYGHIQLRFSVRHIGNKSLRPTTFWIGPDHHKLMIWHNDRIESITYFRTEPPPPDPTYRGNRYHEWRDVQEFDSFTVNRPSPNRFFIGIAILSVTGYLLRGARQTSIAFYSVLILLMFLMVLRYSTLAETFAVQPTLVAVGWLAAPIFGHSLTHNLLNRHRGKPAVDDDVLAGDPGAPD